MESIYTIPLNEIFDEPVGCPFCTIRAKLERDMLDYTLGAAMMEPTVRIEMNSQGFCRTHYAALAECKNKLALALITETRLAEVISKGIVTLTGSCYICNRIEYDETRYLTNAAHMYSTDPVFVEKFNRQNYFCLYHAAGLAAAAKKTLNKKKSSMLCDSMNSILKNHAIGLRADLRTLADSYDYRNAGKELGEEKNALERAKAFM